MSWGGYFFFYECPACGKRYRWQIEDMNEAAFGRCPACGAAGVPAGETKDITQGDARFEGYEDV